MAFVTVVADTVIGEIADNVRGVFERGADTKREGGISCERRWKKSNNGKRGNTSSNGSGFAYEGERAKEFVFHLIVVRFGFLCREG